MTIYDGEKLDGQFRNMIEDKSKILTEQLLRIEGAYDDKFRLYTEAIREHDKAIRETYEKELARIHKEYQRIDQTNPIIRFDKVQGKADGEIPNRPMGMGDTELDSNYRHFIEEEGIGDD